MRYRCVALALLIVLADCRRQPRQAPPQLWETVIAQDRAIDWTSVGFVIPDYTADCAVQPSLQASGEEDAAAATGNKRSIEAALASCDGTHHVVRIPAGTYYVDGWVYGGSNRVVRGAGPNSSTLILRRPAPCVTWYGICLSPTQNLTHTGAPITPPAGSRQCAWTAGYAKGSNPITVSACGSTAPAPGTIVTLDQENDSGDTGGVFLCDTTTSSPVNVCGWKLYGDGNNAGRTVPSGITRSEQHVARVEAVSSNSDGSFALTLDRPVPFSNIRAEKKPGLYWLNQIESAGLEDMTVDHERALTTAGALGGNSPIAIVNCYKCWIRNVRSLRAVRAHIVLWHAASPVITSNYLYGAQGSGSQSYGIEFGIVTGALIENNILHQVTAPMMAGNSSGSVIGYNFNVNNVYAASAMMLNSLGHNAANQMNLWEGNAFNGVNCDGASWGKSGQSTIYRNNIVGWQKGKTAALVPIVLSTGCRAYNVIGNVLGEPGAHARYESYTTSTDNVTAGVNSGAGPSNLSVYNFGWTGVSGTGTCQSGALKPPYIGAVCDPLVRTSTVRWGNWDVVSGAARWDALEASPAALAFMGANFSKEYFESLAHTLPASFYYSSRPAWWPASKPWPAIGPDVAGGNIGICKDGVFNGAQATGQVQCSDGTLTPGWAGHINSIPAQDCYFGLGGPVDGTGPALAFDAGPCYAPPPVVEPPPQTGAVYNYRLTRNPNGTYRLPANATNVRVFKDGLRMRPELDYVIKAGAIVPAGEWAAEANVYIDYDGKSDVLKR